MASSPVLFGSVGRAYGEFICGDKSYKGVLCGVWDHSRTEMHLPNKGHRKIRTCLAKGDITKLLNEGERLVGAYAVVRSGLPQSTKYTPSFDYHLFVTLTGIRGYFPVVEHESTELRVFRSFDRILRMLRELGYHGPVTVHEETDPRRPKASGSTRRRPGEKLAGFSSSD